MHTHPLCLSCRERQEKQKKRKKAQEKKKTGLVREEEMKRKTTEKPERCESSISVIKSNCSLRGTSKKLKHSEDWETKQKKKQSALP